jgi:hypothetical protein
MEEIGEIEDLGETIIEQIPHFPNIPNIPKAGIWGFQC